MKHSVHQTLTPTQRTLRSRIGAYALHAKRDPSETTRAARAKFLARFEMIVDPKGELAPAERERRANAARQAHFARMALRSAQARARKSA
jgi:hypothetical protein